MQIPLQEKQTSDKLLRTNTKHFELKHLREYAIYSERGDNKYLQEISGATLDNTNSNNNN